MDPYTATTKTWLERRFRLVDTNGRYRAHQPIHGFSQSRDDGLLADYLRLYHAFRILTHVRFSSMLDVGSSEGLLAQVVRKRLGARVYTADLSLQACRRAREAFGFPVAAADAHDLPLADQAVDVVVCTETLEHVNNPGRVVAEMMRGARRAVLITVPHEPPQVAEANRAGAEPHAHIHSFDLGTVQALFPHGYRLTCTPIMSALAMLPLKLIEGRRLSSSARVRVGPAASIYDFLRPFLRRFLGPRAAAAVFRSDRLLARLAQHAGILCLAVKDTSSVSERPLKAAPPTDIFSIAAPPLYPPDGIATPDPG